MPGTDLGNGVIPEYYKFDNPQAGHRPHHQGPDLPRSPDRGSRRVPRQLVYYSTVANSPLPTASSTTSGGPTSSRPKGSRPSASHRTAPTYWTGYTQPCSCTPVYFDAQDTITGPIFYQRLHLRRDGSLELRASSGVTTADPEVVSSSSPGSTERRNDFDKCQPQPDRQDNCQRTTSYDRGSHTAQQTVRSAPHNLEPIPTDNSAGQLRQARRLLLRGPTTDHPRRGRHGGVEPDTTKMHRGQQRHRPSERLRQRHQRLPVNNATPAALPVNGVIFVDQLVSGTAVSGANPYDGQQE